MKLIVFNNKMKFSNEKLRRIFMKICVNVDVKCKERFIFCIMEGLR